jgi:sulfofructose kinase
MCIGHAVQDYVFTLPSLPEGGRKFRARGFDCVGGGPAATAAVAIARLGGEAKLAARLGDDSVADTIIEELQGYGVDCSGVRRWPGCRSSLSAVMIDDRGERMIVNYRDPGLPDDASWLAGIAGFDVLLADSKWPAGAIAGFAAARRIGAPAVLDADDPAPDDPALLRGATHIAFSADGLCGLSGETDLAAGLRAIRKRTDAWLCVTDGARGVLVADEAGISSVEAFEVTAVDTLAAGDVWHGAFALALAEGAAEKAAVRFASAAAAIKVTRRGGRAGAPDRADVETLLASNDKRESQR